MAVKPPGYIAAKSIPNEVALQAVADYAAGRGPWPFDALSGWPQKVVGAKLAKLAHRGWIRDAKTITDAGLAVLEESEGRPC